MDKTRFVFVTRNHVLKSPVGGSEERSHLLSTELAKRGWDVYFISEFDHVPEPAVVDGVTLHGLPELNSPFRANGRQLHELLLQLKPDVVFNILYDLYTYHAMREAPAGTFRIWASAAEADGQFWPKLKLLWQNFGALRFCAHLPRHAYPLWMGRKGVRAADLVLVQHEGQQQALRRDGIESEVLHNPQNITEPSAMQPHKGKPLILWMGGIKNWKRPQFFIELARRCRDLDADFVLVGEIQERKYDAVLKAAMEELPNFRYDGVVPRKQVGACFEKAHILVSTSRAEGYPNTFIHAMMHGVPIVSLDVDPEGLLADKGFGRLAKDMDGLEKAVRELAGDPQKRREIGAMEREYAVREFDLKSVVDRLEGILKERGVKMPEIRNPKSEIQK